MNVDLLSLGDATGKSPLRAEHPLAPGKQLLMAGVVAIWAVAGLLGRDPWKPVETEVAALLKGMLGSDGLLQLPALLGMPVLDTPPLYYWLAGLFAAAAPGNLEMHEAARLANLPLLLVTLLCVGACVNLAVHRRFAWDSVLLLTGTIGLLFDAHLLNTHVMAMAGVAAQMLGLSLMRRSTLSGGTLFGAGAAVSFLSAGLIALNVAVLCLALLALISRGWAGRRTAIWLLVASFFLLPAVFLWLSMLERHGGADVGAWLAADRHNLLRYGTDLLGGPLGVAANLVWSAWPLWPIIVIGLLTAWREMLASHTIRAGLAMAGAVLLCLAFSPQRADSESFLLYPPLAVVAAMSLMHARHNFLNAFDWFALMVVSFAAVALMWACWLVAVSGWLPSYAQDIMAWRPGVDLETSPLAVAAAVVMTLGWLGLLAKINRGLHRPVVNWTCGLVLGWTLFCLLWMDYMDAGRSYRQIGNNLAAQHAQARSAEAECVAVGNLSLSEASQLYYFSGVPLSFGEDEECPHLLVKAGAQENAPNGGVPLGERKNGDGLTFHLLRASGQ